MDRIKRRISNTDAIAHNNLVEQARQAEHLLRCARSPAYKRVYERWQKMMDSLSSEQAKLAEIMSYDRIRRQQCEADGPCEEQPKDADKPCAVPPPVLFQSSDIVDSSAAFIIGSMFMTQEQWSQIPEDVKAEEEMRKVNEEYDRQLVRMSGFEW